MGDPRPAAGELVTIPRQELQAFVHDLRNHLNSMLMNSGVLAAHCRLDAKASGHAAHVEQDAEECARMLRNLSDQYL